MANHIPHYRDLVAKNFKVCTHCKYVKEMTGDMPDCPQCEMPGMYHWARLDLFVKFLKINPNARKLWSDQPKVIELFSVHRPINREEVV